MAKNVKIIEGLKVPILHDAVYRMVCIAGEKKGSCYYLEGDRALVGRSKNVDIIVYDVKSSREHAELVRVDGIYTITDLKSQNGVIVNDLKIIQHKLEDQDKIVIGKTVFRFESIVKLESDDDDDDEEQDKTKTVKKDLSKAEDKNKDKNKKKKIIYIVGGIVVAAFLFLGDGDKKKKNNVKTSTKMQDISDSFIDPVLQKKFREDKELRKKLKTIFAKGLREYREGNYYRAINEFNLALVLAPKSGRAQFYLNKTKKALDDEIKVAFLRGKRSVGSLRYKMAIVAYCEIVRLLANYPSDQRYIDSIDNIKEVENLMGKEIGETKCIQE